MLVTSVEDFEIKWNILATNEEQQASAEVWLNYLDPDDRVRYLANEPVVNSINVKLSTQVKDDQLSEAHRRQANKKLASGGLKLNDALASYNISLRFARIPDLPASGAVRDESKDRKYPEERLKDFLRQAGILRSPNDKNENEDNSDDATTASFVPEDGSSEATSDVEEDAGKKAAKADGNDRLGTQARATLFNRAVCLYKMRRYEESMMDLAYCYALKPGEDVEKKILELAQKIGERLAGVRHKEQCPEELVDKAEREMDEQKTKEVPWILDHFLGVLINRNYNQAFVPPKENTIAASDCHESFRQVSRLVDLQFTADNGRGRCFNARTDIQTGTTLMTEMFFAGCLDKDQMNSHCYQCFRRIQRCVPCIGCASVCFCSITCREEAASKHSVECKYMNSLLESPEAVRIAHDVVVRAGRERLLQHREDLERAMDAEALDEAAFVRAGQLGIDLMLRRIDQNSLQDIKSHQPEEDQYLGIFTLCTNEPRVEPEILFRYAVLTHAMSKFMAEAGYFGTEEEDVIEDERRFIAKLLLRHTLQAFMNALPIDEVVIDLRQSKHTVLSVGKAMAVAPCLLNHSCFPNAQVVWSGRHLVVKAVTPVARGDEITICYRPNVIQALESAQDRRDYLRDVFYFDCDCKGCIGEYRSFAVFSSEDALSTPRQIYCPSCNNHVSLKIERAGSKSRIEAGGSGQQKSATGAYITSRNQLYIPPPLTRDHSTTATSTACCIDCQSDLTEEYWSLERARESYLAAVQELRRGNVDTAEALITAFVDAASKLTPPDDFECHRAVRELQMAHFMRGNVYLEI